MEQTFTMMTEEDAPEVGPNDIVIHLVNPYKCGLCELEFLDKAVFKDHIFSHLDQIKQDKPSSQIVMNIILPPETPGGVTVTRDILQLGEDGSIKQVLQPANNITLNQVYPLKELAAAGVIKLEPAHPVKPANVAPTISSLATQSQPQAVNLPNALAAKEVPTNAGDSSLEAITALESSQTTVGTPVGSFIKEEVENNVSEIIENTDGTFSVAFKGPNNEMQHIQIIRPEGMKGEMMLEVTSVQRRRRFSKGTSKGTECDICGKILSSSTNLLRHKMYHSSERPFVCNTCGKGFKDVSNLKKHTMIHNRIFSCHLCKKSFLRKSLLALHLKRHQARTVFVKSGNSAKEVTLRTYMDDDGTRVEEMSMAALSGQTFEYKKRIVKVDPSELKSTVASGQENEENRSGPAAGDAGVSEDNLAAVGGDNIEQKMNGDSLLDQDLVVKGASGEAIDDLPEFKIPDAPKEFVKMYQCGHCGKRTVQRGNMMRHLIHHLNEKPFRCDECTKQFVDKGELVKHKKTHSKPYRCNQCNGAFAHNVQLIKHQESECLGRSGNLKYTALEDGQTYRCDICQIEMKRLGNMIKHVGTHSNGKQKSAIRHSVKQSLMAGSKAKSSSASSFSYDETNETFVCNVCQKVFKQKSNVLSHIDIHISDNAYECSECNRRFPTKATLKKHRSVHLKPFKCDRCPAVFSRKLFLVSHMRRHKEKERGEETDDYGVSEDQSQYYCKHCDKKLSHKFKMMNHIRSHLDNRPYECPECNKCFSGQYMLSNHRKMHSKLFTCDNCGEAFSRKLFLQIHRKKQHSLKKPEIKQATTIHIPDKLRSSMRKSDSVNSSEDKVYSCYICGSSFSRLVIKLNHEKKCKEERKILRRVVNGNGFQCRICRRISTLKHNLMVHIRKAHGDMVRFEPNGHIHLKGGMGSSYEDVGESWSQGVPLETKDAQSPPKKKLKLTSRKKEEDDLSDDEVEALAAVMEEGEDESDTDDRYTHTPGGYACTTCRTRFLDRDALFTHLESHGQESKESGGAEMEGHAESSINKDSVKEEEEGETVSVGEKAEGEVSEEVNKTPGKRQGRPPGSSSAKAKRPKVEQNSKQLPKTPSASSLVKTESSDQTPSSLSRSSNRPPRTQKIPSRYLE